MLQLVKKGDCEDTVFACINRVWFISACVLMCLYSSSGRASIHVSPMSLNLYSTHPKQPAMTELRVFNDSNMKPAYVSLQLRLGKRLSTPQEKMVPVERPAQNAGIIITPMKMIIPAKQSRLVRIIRPKQPQKNSVYSLKIMPHSSGFSGKGSKISIQVAYAVFLYDRPYPMRIKVTATRKGKLLRVTNRGNTTLKLGWYPSNCKSEVCPKRISRKLYVGIPREVKLPYAKPLKFSLSVPGRTEHWTSP